ncbi:MAG: hydantoinase/oxoprolinase family protein [Pseudomonadota bacterium]
MEQGARLAVDIGGTFTDIAIETGGREVTAKTPTTPADPVEGVLIGARLGLERAGLQPGDIRSVIHGTTLATNALIERRGASVALITTEGFRDVLEIAYERRYDQYDIWLDKPDMIVPRERCLTVPERVDPDGSVVLPLDEGAIDRLIGEIDASGAESLAIGLLHSYVNPNHERRLRELILARRPELTISLSSEVCPEIREYDRLCTTVANAYIKPMMTRYLGALERRLGEAGFHCPLFVITSGGGMTTLATAVQFPIRLVESGPSGGAILAARIARQCGLDEVVSFDMGGTTAKICLIDDGEPQSARQFEIARAARFIKGSGLPVRIPVIEMIEIGAGGGSLAAVDGLGRVTIGPESAGADPGPACYALGGTRATVTDSDAVIGLLDPERFAEGRLKLEIERARDSITHDVAAPLGFSVEAAADGVGQMVDESMANAARMHAVERGKALDGRTLIAFGGNGPLHASRVAEKLGIARILVPPDPGVGSAVGFLAAPVSYEIVRSLPCRLDRLDLGALQRLFAEMEAEALEVVQAGAPGQALEIKRSAFMRYQGQGHEIEVALGTGAIDEAQVAGLGAAYERLYGALYGRHVPSMTIEVMNWSVVVSTGAAPPQPVPPTNGVAAVAAAGAREVYFGRGERKQEVPWYARADLTPGAAVAGPALIVEPQTSTYLSPEFEGRVDGAGNLILTRRAAQGA